MLDLSRRPEQFFSKAQSWLVSFEEAPAADAGEKIVVKEPRDVTAVLIRVETAQSLSEDAPKKPGALTVVCAPPSAQDAPGDEADLEAWVRGGADDHRAAPVRASVRTARTLWLHSRAVAYASEELSRDALDALVRFTVAERETERLEKEVHALWPVIAKDSRLTHAVEKTDLKRQEHVNAMTVLATKMKAASLRIQTALEQLDPALTDPSKRLFAELVLAAGLHDRLELLFEPVQFALEHYELANTRLIDAKASMRENANFVSEQIMQLVIIALLLAEFVVMLYGIRLFL
ncbi:MAG TPA: hypothetical protein VEH76_06975 [Methylocystis sp.]|nr:hypothetical protein [Methylocystis sp.]